MHKRKLEYRMDLNKQHTVNLLIAEKDEDLAKSLELFFSDTFNVAVVNDFSAVEQSISRTHILLLDENIIDYAGIHYLQKIKKTAPHLIIIVMHTVPSVNVLKQSQYKQYTDAAVYKPFEPNSLYEIITRLYKTSEIHQP